MEPDNPVPVVDRYCDNYPRLREIVQDMRLHFNSYNELIDARRHLNSAQTSDEIGDIKAAIRSAASGVDPLLRFYCKLHSIRFPSRSLPFDQKVEEILARTGMPSYRAVSPHGMERVTKLYRARNSMHEGDRYFTDGGMRLTVDYDLAKQFVEAAEQFAIWLDSLALSRIQGAAAEWGEALAPCHSAPRASHMPAASLAVRCGCYQNACIEREGKRCP